MKRISIIIYSLIVCISGLGATEIYNNLQTFEKLTPPKENTSDDLFLKGVIPSSKESAEVLGDFYWARKCSSSFDGVVEWNEKEKFCRSKKFSILLDLKERMNTNDKNAALAYKSIVLTEHTQNCEKKVNTDSFFIELTKEQ